MRAKRTVPVLVAAALVPLAAGAAGPIPLVTTDELKAMVDAKEQLFLADALSPIEFAEERIAGSVNVPYSALRSGKAKLPADKAKRVIFYCKGPKCTKSHKAARLAREMGHTNVAVYDEGLPAWLARGFPAETRKVYPAVEVPAVTAAGLRAMLDAKEPLVILDIRDDDDRAAGTVPGSTAVELELLDARAGELPKGRKIVIVDLHGKQSLIAGRFLASKGFGDVSRLDGGFIGGWLKAGFPVAR